MFGPARIPTRLFPADPVRHTFVRAAGAGQEPVHDPAIAKNSEEESSDREVARRGVVTAHALLPCEHGLPRTGFRYTTVTIAIAIATTLHPVLSAHARKPQTVRAADSRIEALIAEGRRRSPAFRLLIEQLEQSTVLIYVNYRMMPAGLIGRLTLLTEQRAVAVRPHRNRVPAVRQRADRGARPRAPARRGNF